MSSQDLIDITDLLRSAADSLTYSHPFTPTDEDAAAFNASCGDGGDVSDDVNGSGGGGDGNGDVGSLEDLLQVTFLDNANGQNKPPPPADHNNSSRVSRRRIAPINLRDAMSALELGDKRMDCCEIPHPTLNTGDNDTAAKGDARCGKEDDKDYSAMYQDIITYPPRIAPISLGDGTPVELTGNTNSNGDTSGSTNASFSLDKSSNYQVSAVTHSSAVHSESIDNQAPTAVPTSPCPSLYPFWETLSLCPSSPTYILPLMIIQFTALEAYVGTNSGGSTAAETLFCCCWAGAGVVEDMAERLGVRALLQAETNDIEDDGKGGDGEKEVGGGELKRTEANGQDVTANGGDTKASANLKASDNSHGKLDELQIAQWTLFATTLGSLRLAELIKNVVRDADIYEEEDFGLDWDMALDIGEEDLNATHELITSNVGRRELNTDVSRRELNTSDVKRRDFGFAPEGRGVNLIWSCAIDKLEGYKLHAEEEEAEGIQNMISLLRAQQSLYLAIQILYNLNEGNVVEFAEKAVGFSRETVMLLENLKGSSLLNEFGTLMAVDGRLCDVTWFDCPEKNRECALFLSASFDPFVNRRSLGNAPIRKARFNPLTHVIDSMSNLAAELEWAVCDVILNANTLGRLTRMLTNNSSRGRGGAVPIPPPADAASCHVGINILSRSLMLLNLYFDDKLLGQYDFLDIIGQNMVQLSAVPTSMTESTGWVARLSKPLYDTLKALCLDRHRERTFTESILFPAFATLQNEAAAVDEIFRESNGLDPSTTPPYATNYTIVQTLRLMERHVGLGIELGLYPHWYDLSQAFWYRDFLLTALLNVRGTLEKERIQRKIVEYQIKMEEEEEKKNALVEHQFTQKKGKKKKGKKPKGPASPPLTASNSRELAIDAISKISPESFEDKIDYTLITLRRSLCRGMVRLIEALRHEKLLVEPPSTMTLFTNHQRRFEKRFEIFSELPQPPSLSYDDYRTGSDFSAVPINDLIMSTKECFRIGKSSVDRLLEVILPNDTTVTPNITEQRKNDDLFISIRREEIMALAKVCVSNSLFLLKLETSLDSKEKVTLVFNAHKEFCTLMSV